MRFKAILGSEHHLTKQIQQLTVSCRMWDEYQFLSNIQLWQDALVTENENSGAQDSFAQLTKYLDVALRVLEENNWGDLERNPDKYGIPHKLFNRLNRAQRDEPVVLPAEAHRGIINLVHILLNQGGGVFIINNAGYPHLIIPFEVLDSMLGPGTNVIPSERGLPARTVRLGNIALEKAS